MTLKSNISDYTELEFIELISAIDNATSEEARGELVEHFNTLVPHPAGSDLLFYPEEGADDSAEGVTKVVREWLASHGLPGFKQLYTEQPHN